MQPPEPSCHLKAMVYRTALALPNGITSHYRGMKTKYFKRFSQCMHCFRCKHGENYPFVLLHLESHNHSNTSPKIKQDNHQVPTLPISHNCQFCLLERLDILRQVNLSNNICIKCRYDIIHSVSLTSFKIFHLMSAIFYC